MNEIWLKKGFSATLCTIPLDGNSVRLQTNSQQEELGSIMRMGSSFSNDQICVQLIESEVATHLILHIKHLNIGTHLDPTVF